MGDKLRCSLGLCGVLLSVAVLRADATARSGHISMVLVRDTFVLVPVEINDTGPFLFLLDTGASSTLMSERLARRLDLVVTSHQPIDTLAGAAVIRAGHIESLRLGGSEWTDLDVSWTDLRPLQNLDRRIEGVLGLDVLAHVDFLIDFRAKSVSLLPAAEAERTVEGHKTPMHVIGQHLGVKGTLDGRESRPLSLVLDSGASDLILYTSRVAPADVAGASRLGPAQLDTLAGRRPVSMVRLACLVLGQTSLRDVIAGMVEEPEGDRPEDGLLPLRLFRRIYLAPSAGYVIFNPRPSS